MYEIPLLYRTLNQNGGYFSQLNCRTFCPYMQSRVWRWFSTRKDARVILLRKEHEIMKSPRILLIGDDNKRIGEMSSQEAFQLGTKRGMEVVIVNKPIEKGEMVTCKLVHKNKIQGSRLSSKPEKVIELKTGIADHDFRTKIKKINELLEKGVYVCVNVRSRPSKNRAANTMMQKRLLEQVCKQANGMGGKTSVKATMVTCRIKPLGSIEMNK